MEKKNLLTTKMEVKIKLSSSEYQDLVSFCNLNDLLISDVVRKSFTSGFNIEKYGLLGGTEKVVEVEKEVIKEVEVIREIVKEVEVIKEVPSPPIEVKIIEYVDREVIKEIPVEKIVNVYDNSEVEKLLNRITELENLEPKTIEIIREVRVERPIEVIKEVYIEKPDNLDLKNKFDALQSTLQNLRKENMEKENKIKEYEQKIIEINKSNFDRNAVFLRNSNLNDTLFK